MVGSEKVSFSMLGAFGDILSKEAERLLLLDIALGLGTKDEGEDSLPRRSPQAILLYHQYNNAEHYHDHYKKGRIG